MKAKKSLGQHFLKSDKALRQIVEAGDIQSTDLILEIGPGHGVLTELLIPLASKVIAIEKDCELIPILQEKFAPAIEKGKLEIVQADILKWDPESIHIYSTSYKLVANIPYYITGAIIEQFLSAPFQPTTMVLLMQKEVAERIVSRDGKESVLSIAVKAYGKPRIVGKVPPGAFNPPPTVDSAILSIDGITRDFFEGCDEVLFFKILKGIFGKKRKQLGGSLAEIIANKDAALAILATLSIDPTTRPERLTLTQWKSITIEVQKIVH